MILKWIKSSYLTGRVLSTPAWLNAYSLPNTTIPAYQIPLTLFSVCWLISGFSITGRNLKYLMLLIIICYWLNIYQYNCMPWNIINLYHYSVHRQRFRAVLMQICWFCFWDHKCGDRLNFSHRHPIHFYCSHSWLLYIFT